MPTSSTGAKLFLVVMGRNTLLIRNPGNILLMPGMCFGSIKKNNNKAQCQFQLVLCVIGCFNFGTLMKNIPSMYTYTCDSGFETITELLNIVRLGHLRIGATQGIAPLTEIVMDYFVERSCFHPSGSCSCRTCIAFLLLSGFLVN